MTHRFPIKEIARQAGLGVATVDRVLNARPHVSPQARRRVTAALQELEAQEAQLAARGRRIFVDVIVEAPKRFSAEVRRAAEEVALSFRGAVFRPRFTLQETMKEGEMLATLARVQKRGTQGICLKARDTPALRTAVAQLTGAGIPVVTLVTDIQTDRLAYVGLDNAGAGRTAAWMIARMLPQGATRVLTTRSRDTFLGETVRLEAFRREMAQVKPGVTLIETHGGGGLPHQTRRDLEQILPTGGGPVDGVYSMGGGNAAILEALSIAQSERPLFIAHDLDAENRDLLAQGRIDIVLHHDLRHDMRAMFSALAVHHGLMPPSADLGPSAAQVVTPHNLPG